MKSSRPVVQRCAGLFPDVQFEQATLLLDPGNVLVAFSDGVSDAMNGDGEEFGEERLIEVVQGCLTMDAAAARDQIDAATRTFVADAPQHDDLTLLVAVRQGLDQS